MTAGHSPYTPEYVEVLLGEEVCAAMAARAPQGKWSVQRWAKLLHATYMGLNMQEAAAYAGIVRETLRLWREACPQLQETLDQAGPAGTLELVQRLDKDLDTAPLTARWRLERRSDSFKPPAKRTEHKVEGELPKIVLERHEGLSVPVPPEISGVEEESE